MVANEPDALRFVIVVNPVSGRGRGRPTAEALQQRLINKGYASQIIETLADAEAFRSALSVIRADDRIVCIGGDGTLLYFVNHAPPFRDVAFFGMGTANVVSIEFNLPRQLDSFVDMLEAGVSVPIYPGKLGDGTRFLMMASFGLDGFILASVSQNLKNRLGKLAFVPAFFRAVFSYGYPPMDVHFPNGTQKRCHFAVVTRFRHYGGPYLLAPAADPSQPLLQLVGLTKPGGLAMLAFFIKLWFGRLKPSKHVFFEAAPSFKVVHHGLPAQVDGDLFGRPIERVEVDRQVIDLIVPKG